MRHPKITPIAIALVALSSVACSSVPVEAHPAPTGPVTQVQINGALDPYGEWVVVSSYGRVWRPLGVSQGWAPYTHGRWVTYSSTWAWQSDYPWGWAAFHYGRWYHDTMYGWVWVPGDVWGPAWVAWRSDGDWVGWAPLAPGVAWRGGAYYGVLGPDAWCFVRRRDFGRRPVRRVRARPADHHRLIGRTHVHAAAPPRSGRRGAQPAPAPLDDHRARPARRARTARPAAAAPAAPTAPERAQPAKRRRAPAAEPALPQRNDRDDKAKAKAKRKTKRRSERKAKGARARHRK